jgi:hypothetical protein
MAVSGVQGFFVQAASSFACAPHVAYSGIRIIGMHAVCMPCMGYKGLEHTYIIPHRYHSSKKVISRVKFCRRDGNNFQRRHG